MKAIKLHIYAQKPMATYYLAICICNFLHLDSFCVDISSCLFLSLDIYSADVLSGPQRFYIQVKYNRFQVTEKSVHDEERFTATWRFTICRGSTVL